MLVWAGGLRAGYYQLTRLMRFTESPQPGPEPESDIGALRARAGDGLRGLITGISGIMAWPAASVIILSQNDPDDVQDRMEAGQSNSV